MKQFKKYKTYTLPDGTKFRAKDKIDAEKYAKKVEEKS